MRAALRWIAALAVLAAGLVVPGSLTWAQDAPGLYLRSVDATDPSAVAVTFRYDGDRADLADLVVREEGVIVEASTAVPLAEERALQVALVIDVSISMEEGALIERVLEAARSFVEAKAEADEIAIVTFSGEVQIVEEFTTDERALLEALESMPLGRGTSAYDAIVTAAEMFEGTERQPNILIFSDGGDTTSAADATRARAAVTNAGGALFAMGVENDGFASLRDIAMATGGAAVVADDAGGVNALFAQVQAALQNQFVVTYASRSESGGETVPVQLSVGRSQAGAEIVLGSRLDASANLTPRPAPSPPGPAFLRTEAGLFLGLALIAVAAFAAAMSLGTIFAGPDRSLDETLRPYGEGYVPADEEQEGRASLATSALMQRAVAATQEIAERQGILARVEKQLDQANLALRPAEAIFFYVAGVVVVGALLLVLAGSAFSALVGLILMAMAPPAILSFLAGRRRKEFQAQLPDMLQLLASTLRAGFSLMKGVEAVSTEVGEPMGRELRRVVTEARLGRPLEEALEGVAERMGSADFEWAVMAIRIQREVGGNLAELLVTVADTMTERERLRRDVNALTAEGRVSAFVLGLLPVGLGVFIMGANPGYLDPLFEESMGRIMLIGAGVLMGAGFFWMKKLIEIEI